MALAGKPVAPFKLRFPEAPGPREPRESMKILPNACKSMKIRSPQTHRLPGDSPGPPQPSRSAPLRGSPGPPGTSSGGTRSLPGPRSLRSLRGPPRSLPGPPPRSLPGGSPWTCPRPARNHPEPPRGFPGLPGACSLQSSSAGFQLPSRCSTARTSDARLLTLTSILLWTRTPCCRCFTSTRSSPPCSSLPSELLCPVARAWIARCIGRAAS